MIWIKISHQPWVVLTQLWTTRPCSFFKQYFNFIQKRPPAGRDNWQLKPLSHESDHDQHQFSPNNFST